MKLFFRKYGEGPALIILHGLFGSSDNWVSIAKKISGRFTVILPDLRNHGLSPHSQVHDYDSMSNDLLELADNLNLGKFFLAGHSMGGKTAISFACKWPERLNGLLVADISPFESQKKDSEAVKQHIEVLNTFLSINAGSLNSRTEAERLVSSRISNEKLVGLILKNLQRNDDNTFAWKLNARSLLQNIEKILEGIRPENCVNYRITGFPVYFLKGEKSSYLPEKDFGKILEFFPATEFITVPSAGHWIQTDNPRAVAESLLSFIV